MILSFCRAFANYFLPPTERDNRALCKRRRQDSGDSEPGEIAKRLCSMTEERMAGSSRYSNMDRRNEMASHDSDENEVEVLDPDKDRTRLCLPRRPGRRLTDPPRAPITGAREIPVKVEREERDIPVLVEGRQASPTTRRQLHQRAGKETPSTAKQPPSKAREPPSKAREPPSKARESPSKNKQPSKGSGADDDIVVLEEIKTPVKYDAKTDAGGGFEGLRSFRQMVETGRVAGRSSSYARSPLQRKQQQEHQQQRSSKQKSLYEKLIGMAPSKLKFRRGLSTMNCFRLDERRLYKQMLAEHARAGSPASFGLDAPVLSTSYRTKSLLASPPAERPAAVRRDRLDSGATSRLSQQVALVDLTSSGSESSAQRPPAASAAGAASAPIVLSDGESASQQASGGSDSDSIEVVKEVPAAPRRRTMFDRDLDKSFQALTEIRDRYAALKRDRERRIREEEGRQAAAGASHAEWERRLAERLRRQMALTQRVALEAEPELEPEEEEEEEEALPELTDEMEKIISAALRPSPPTEVMAEAFSQRITRHDLQTLKGLNWLNDEVINFYMNMIMDRSKNNDKLPKVYCFNTFFYGKIVSQGHGSVKRWTRKVDIFSHDLLMIPVHLGMHWCLACVDLRSSTIRYLDSMGGNNNTGLNATLRYLRDEHLDKKKEPLDTSGWTTVNEKDIPQQMNGSDCGMFACKFAEYLSRDARISFSQEDMPYFRRRMVYEIVTKRLM